MSTSLPRDLVEFLNRHGYTPDEWAKAELSWDDLKAIRADHEMRYADLATAGRALREKLEQCRAIHTIKMRVKSPENVAEKVLRKKLESPERDLTLATYRIELTDLVGIRGLHLFKEQWEEIHAFVSGEFDLAEPAMMYHHKGDKFDCTLAERMNVIPKEHGRGYRSAHYLLQAAPIKDLITIELQIRTQAEDLWSEVDHRARYSREADIPAHEEQVLDLLNIFTAAADGLVSYVQQMKQLTAQMIQRDTELQSMAQALTALESSSSGKDEELRKLRASLERMRKAERETALPMLTRPALASLADALEQYRDTQHSVVGSLTRSLPRCAKCGEISIGIGTSGLCTKCGIMGVLGVFGDGGN